MKKLILSTLFVLGITGVFAQSNNNNDLIGRARGAANAAGCFADVPQGVEVKGTIEEIIFFCFDPNTLIETIIAGYRVHLYAPNPCPPHHTCVDMVVPIATVTFGCDNTPYVECE